MADYPLKAICDTSIYIPFINRGIAHPLFADERVHPVLYMSSVVLSDLYAGAHDSRSIKLLDKLYQTFLNVGRLVGPTDGDWRQTGIMLAKLRKKHGFESRHLSRLQNDVLIACSARRTGAFIVTRNTKDFMRIGEFLDVCIYG